MIKIFLFLFIYTISFSTSSDISCRVSSDTSPCKVKLGELDSVNVLISGSNDRTEALHLFDGDLSTYAKAAPYDYRIITKASIIIDLLKSYHVTGIFIYHIFLTERCGSWRKRHPCLPENINRMTSGCREGRKAAGILNSTVRFKAFRDTRSKIRPVYLKDLDLANETIDFKLTTNFIGNRLVLDRNTSTGGILISDIVLVGTPFEEGPCTRGFIRLPLRCTENKTDNCRPYRKFY
ncbi:hypothetical protein ACHWQZ_G016111 [Mnemiopsis leidyi]